MLYRFFVLLLVSINVSCNSSVSKTDIEKFAAELFSIISCPDVQPFFGGFAVCAESYDVGDKLIKLNMKWSSVHKMALPFEKWEKEGKSNLFLKDVVCDAVSSALGITDEAIFKERSGIIQRVDVSSRDDDFRQQMRMEFAARVRMILSLSDGTRNYVVTRWAYDESTKVPELCTVEKRIVRVESS